MAAAAATGGWNATVVVVAADCRGGGIRDGGGDEVRQSGERLAVHGEVGEGGDEGGGVFGAANDVQECQAAVSEEGGV